MITECKQKVSCSAVFSQKQSSIIQPKLALKRLWTWQTSFIWSECMCLLFWKRSPCKLEKIELECQRNSNYESPAYPKHLQFATTTLSTVSSEVGDKPVGLTAKDQEYRTEVSPISRRELQKRRKRLVGRNNKGTVLLWKPLKFLLRSTGFAFKAKPTYNLCIISRFSVSAMHTASSLLKFEAGINCIHLPMVRLS